MIIYSVEVKGDITNDDWSIVTIWKSEEDAIKAKEKYITNCSNNEVDLEYRIKELDTDSECIYDCYDE